MEHLLEFDFDNRRDVFPYIEKQNDTILKIHGIYLKVGTVYIKAGQLCRVTRLKHTLPGKMGGWRTMIMATNLITKEEVTQWVTRDDPYVLVPREVVDGATIKYFTDDENYMEAAASGKIDQ